MDENLKLCTECGRTAKSKINIQLVSGTERVTHINDDGVERTIKTPKAEHSFDVCEDCFRKEKMLISGKRPLNVIAGCLLTFTGLFLAFFEIKGFINGDISLWIDTGTGLKVMPWIAVVIAFAIPMIPFFIGIVCLRNGLSSTMTQVTEVFEGRYISQIINKLKENDPNGRYFACTQKYYREIQDAQNKRVL